jgi:hypothetical protein
LNIFLREVLFNVENLAYINYRQIDIEDKLDIVGLDVKGCGIIGLYKPFKLPENESRKSFFHTILKNLKALSQVDREIIIGGDFNIDLNKPSAELHDIMNWSLSVGLSQLVKNYTWRRTVLDKILTSAIDHVYTNIPTLTLTHQSSISDHDMLIVSKILVTAPRRKIKIRDWRSYTTTKATTELSNRIGQISEPQSYNSVCGALLEVVNELAPERVIRIKDNQIISPKLEKAKKKRDRLFKRFRKGGSIDMTLLKEIKKLNAKIKKILRDEKVRAFQSRAKSPDPKVFWQAVNDSLGKRKMCTLSLEINGEHVTDPIILANTFASFFSEKVKSYSNQP